MKRYLSLIILLVTIFAAASHNIPINDTKYDEVNVKSDQNFPLDHITVETVIETNKTMTAGLGQGRELAQGRTFAIKRLQFMLLPVMYKLGVMSTLLVTLVIISLKSLLIGVILLVVKVGGFIASLKGLHHETHSSPPAYSWPQPWPNQQSQPIHIHVHNTGDKHHIHDYHSPYDRQDQQVQYQIPSGWDASAISNPYEKAVAIDSHGQYIFRG